MTDQEPQTAAERIVMTPEEITARLDEVRAQVVEQWGSDAEFGYLVNQNPVQYAMLTLDDIYEICGPDIAKADPEHAWKLILRFRSYAEMIIDGGERMATFSRHLGQQSLKHIREKRHS